jgi:hypothetical protein
MWGIGGVLLKGGSQALVEKPVPVSPCTVCNRIYDCYIGLLKEEALDLTLLRIRFGRGYGPVVRQTKE